MRSYKRAQCARSHAAGSTGLPLRRNSKYSAGRPCPPEVVIDRLASGGIQPRSLRLRLLAKAQGRLAGWAHLWRG